jgi:hypothetical protein
MGDSDSLPCSVPGTAVKIVPRITLKIELRGVWRTLLEAFCFQWLPVADHFTVLCLVAANGCEVKLFHGLVEADPPLPHPSDMEPSMGTPVAKDDRQKNKGKCKSNYKCKSKDNRGSFDSATLRSG